MYTIKKITQYLIGAIFIASAILKLLSIDHFEIYIYSFNFFQFDLSSLVARLVISLELFLGAAIIAGIYYKQIWRLTLSVLILFSVFLSFLVITGETENCHCFGKAIQLSPLESLIKNIVLIGLLFFIKPSENKNFKYRKIVLAIILLAAISTPFIVSPPDCFYSSDVSTKDVDKELLSKILTENQIKDKKLIAFFGAGCRYCKLTAQKINTLKINASLTDQDIYYVFWGREEGITKFMENTKSQSIPYSVIEPKEFLTFTRGKMPVILLMNGDSVLAKLKYSSLNEKMLNSFLSVSE